MRSTVKVEGLSELLKSLEQFKKSTGRGVLERTLKRVAKPIAADAKQAAPVDTGNLKASIVTEVIRDNAGKRAFAEAMLGGASRKEAGAAARSANRAAAGQGASATVRIRAKAPHSIFAEFGTIKQGAQPFLGPALRGKASASMATIKTELGKEIAATAKRVANRKARMT